MHVHYTWIHTKEYTFLPDFSAPCLNHRTRKQSNCYPTNISRFVLIPYFGSQLFSTIQGLVEGSLKIFRLKVVHNSPWQHEKKASMGLVVFQEGSKPRREAGRHHWWGTHQLPVVTTSFSHCRFWASSKLCHNMVIHPPNKFNQLVFERKCRVFPGLWISVNTYDHFNRETYQSLDAQGVRLAYHWAEAMPGSLWLRVAPHRVAKPTAIWCCPGKPRETRADKKQQGEGMCAEIMFKWQNHYRRGSVLEE